jgi:hypothetical protein
MHKGSRSTKIMVQGKFSCPQKPTRNSKIQVLTAANKKMEIHPDDGSSKRLRNIRQFLPDYTSLHARRQSISYPALSKPGAYKNI